MPSRGSGADEACSTAAQKTASIPERDFLLRDELCASGSKVETTFPDSSAEHLFGANGMDLSLRPPAARAGHEQGRALAEKLTAFWR